MFSQEKDKIIDRSNIYSRCHISPAKTKQTSLSTANSMISLRPPLSGKLSIGFHCQQTKMTKFYEGATLDSKSRSKSYHGNLNSTTDNNAKDDEKSWGRTTTIYEKISGKYYSDFKLYKMHVELLIRLVF